ncbi:MAG: hypothetical protein IIA61_08665 [Candidatus Marinimicrobia bacterium]|nr:hypothetical protein [Candidatus Neomarinimicrobiota bacterium]
MKETLDTVKTIYQQTLADYIDIIQKVDAFYNSAWDKLIIIGSVAFVIMGVAVPLIVQWYQRRTLKLSEELLKKDISEQVKKIKSEIIEIVSVEIKTQFGKYETEIKKLNASANAKTFLIQGKLNLEKSYHQLALGDIVSASFSFIESDDYQNLQIALNLILSDCLPHLSKEEIDDLKININRDLELLITNLGKADDRGVFQTVMQDIRLKITKLPKTIQEKPQEKAK